LKRTGSGAPRAFLTPWLLVGAGDFADVFGTSSAHSLSRLVSDDSIVNSLGALATFNERKFDFQFALAVSFGIFNCELHICSVKMLNS
jgi:hypothetical protein